MKPYLPLNPLNLLFRNFDYFTKVGIANFHILYALIFLRFATLMSLTNIHLNFDDLASGKVNLNFNLISYWHHLHFLCLGWLNS